jgi:hypothetical protein
MPPAGFETAIPVGNRPQSHALDRLATEIGNNLSYVNKFEPSFSLKVWNCKEVWQINLK